MLLEACAGSTRETALRALGTELRDSVWSELSGTAVTSWTELPVTCRVTRPPVIA